MIPSFRNATVTIDVKKNWSRIVKELCKVSLGELLNVFTSFISCFLEELFVGWCNIICTLFGERLINYIYYYTKLLK